MKAILGGRIRNQTKAEMVNPRKCPILPKNNMKNATYASEKDYI